MGNGQRALWRAVGLGLVSRVCFYLFIVLFDAVIRDHDAQGVMRINGEGAGDWAWWNSFTKWDAAYYLRISLQGYQDERDFAFFPLYPLLISLLNNLIVEEKTLETAVAIGLFLNTLCFILTILIMYFLLSSIPTVSQEQIQTSLLFFIFSPASIFFLSVYTESLFCFLSFSAMMLLRKNRVFLASVSFLLASLTRSNGIFNVIFIAGYHLSTLLASSSSTTTTSPTLSSLSWRSLAQSFLFTLHSSLFAALPFLFHSLFTSISLCQPLSSDFGRLPSSLSDWDSDSCPQQPALGLCEGGVLFMYSALQRKHWNVGFLTQYHWRQIPNFLLALPVLFLATFTLFRYLSFSLTAPNLHHRLPLLLSLFPYALHLMALLSVLCLSAHIQISTRVLLSSSPLLYLSIPAFSSSQSHPQPASLVGNLFPGFPRYSWRRRLLFGWLLTFLFGGLILHPNSFPWT